MKVLEVKTAVDWRSDLAESQSRKRRLMSKVRRDLLDLQSHAEKQRKTAVARVSNSEARLPNGDIPSVTILNR